MIERITTTFRISLYLLLALSVVTIGVAEGRFFPHFLTLPLIAMAYAYLDERPWLRMESLTTSLLGIVALVVALYEFQQGRINVEMRILSASHLLAYFCWIVLLIEKDSQQYWWLLALSVLNMAVSASLTSSGGLGLAVVAYLFLAAWTLSLFTAYRGTASLRLGSTRPGSSPASATIARPAAVAASPAPLVTVTGTSRARGGFHIDPTDNWLGYRLLGNVLFLSVASLMVGLGIFMMTPRIWIGNWQLPSSSEEAIAGLALGKSISGFTTEVRLGDLGQILDNPTPVMYVDFSDIRTDEKLSVEQVLDRFQVDDLLFRGTALSVYQRGGWNEDYETPRPVELSQRNAPRSPGSVRFNYELEPVGRYTIFTVHPVDFGTMLNDKSVMRHLQYNLFTQELSFSTISESMGVTTFRYETVAVPDSGNRTASLELKYINNAEVWQQFMEFISESIEEEYQQGVTAFHRQSTELDRFPMNRQARPLALGFDRYYRSLLDLDRNELSDLVELARNLCESSEGGILPPEERCRKIQAYLRDSGEFSYTLNMAIQDAEIDPVVDFLINRKSGHCEYFASSMALMLRGVGVPARIVSGFKGGRWNERKNQLVVEQRHAHAWVEAFVGGRWLVFDPTTARDDYGQDGSGGLGYSLAALWGHLNSFWQNKIIGVSLARQQSDIYEPIMKGLNNARAGGLNLVESFQNRLQSSPGRGRTPQDYLFYGSVLLFCVVIIAAVLLYLYFRSAIYLFGWRFSARKRPEAQQQMLQFFRRFLEISALNGLRKAPQLTAREFALLFQERFRWQLQLNSLEELPLSLTNAYYQARFRGDKLSESDLEHWKKRLDSLGHVLNQRRETGRSRVSQ